MKENQKKKKNNDKDVFHDAAMESALKGVVEKASKPDDLLKTEDKSDLLKEIENRLESNDSQWDVLSNMVEGGFTSKFIKIMESMNDRDFTRNYLKLLEHFKPKLTRAEPGKSIKPDNVINIQTMIINSDGEREIIDITNIQDEEE